MPNAACPPLFGHEPLAFTSSTFLCAQCPSVRLHLSIPPSLYTASRVSRPLTLARWLQELTNNGVEYLRMANDRGWTVAHDVEEGGGKPLFTRVSGKLVEET